MARPVRSTIASLVMLETSEKSGCNLGSMARPVSAAGDGHQMSILIARQSSSVWTSNRQACTPSDVMASSRNAPHGDTETDRVPVGRPSSQGPNQPIPNSSKASAQIPSQGMILGRAGEAPETHRARKWRCWPPRLPQPNHSIVRPSVERAACKVAIVSEKASRALKPERSAWRIGIEKDAAVLTAPAIGDIHQKHKRSPLDLMSACSCPSCAYRKSSPSIFVMQSTQDRTCTECAPLPRRRVISARPCSTISECACQW